MGEKVMIPGGWYWQREVSNTQYHPGPVEERRCRGAKDDSWWMEYAEGGQ